MPGSHEVPMPRSTTIMPLPPPPSHPRCATHVRWWINDAGECSSCPPQHGVDSAAPNQNRRFTQHNPQKKATNANELFWRRTQKQISRAPKLAPRLRARRWVRVCANVLRKLRCYTDCTKSMRQLIQCNHQNRVHSTSLKGQFVCA